MKGNEFIKRVRKLAKTRGLSCRSRARKGEYPVHVPLATALKAALYLAVREAGIARSELARRLDIDEKEARRMLDPKHATKTPALERALRALGKQVEVRVS